MSDEATAPRRRIPEGVWGRMRVALACGLAALLVLSVYYFFFVQRKYNYLTGRNFRFLAAIGAQLESSLQSRGKLLDSLAQQRDLGEALQDQAQKGALIKDFAPGYEDVRVASPWPGAAPGQPVFVLRGSGSGIEVGYTAPGTGGGKPGISLRGSIKLRTVAEPLFQSRKAFEALLLADDRGQVVYHQGTDDLSVTRLDLLLEKSLGRRAGSRESKGEAGRLLASSSESYDVELNGRDYRLFVEPIHLSLQEREAPGERTVWLVCGLVPRKELVYKSLAVSSALLSSLLALVVLTALSWPFLKLFLISKTQRVSLFDVLLLGICGLLGISIVTLYLLDWAAFQNLEGTSRQQLDTLADTMEGNVRDEIRAAYPVLTALEETLAPAVARGEAQGELPGLLAYRRGGPEPFDARELFDRNYPFAQTFALIAADGRQIYKASVNQRVPPLIPVRDRIYFKRAAENNVWDLRALEDITPRRASSGPDRGPQPFYVEPIIGWTNREHMAMLSKPVAPQILAAGSAAAPAPKVSSLALPMVSLIRAILPPGVKLAVIDNETEDGRVLFHSDLERMLKEDFLVETDQDRHLRSAVFARRSETMPIRYWGEDYFARTTPVRGLPWTIVVLQDMRILRAVNVDWISTTLVMILLYVGLLALALVMIAAVRPSYRAAWVWPDPQRHWDYRILSRAYVALLTGFILAVWGLRSSPQLIELAYSLPALALVLAYLKLHRRPSGRIFALAAGSLLLLVCAVLLFEGDVPLETGVPGWLPWAILLLVCIAFLTAGGAFPEGRRKLAPPPAAGDDLSPQPPAPAKPARLAWPSVTTSYCLAGTLLLFLTAALPTAGFFKVAHDLHLVSFLRHGQLELSLELKDRAVRARQTVMKVARSGPERACLLGQRLAVEATGSLPRGCVLPPHVTGLDNYAAAFYRTRVHFPPAGRHNSLRECSSDADLEILPDAIEDLLPRYSEPAAQMRELLHSSASDCIWYWGKEHPTAPSSEHTFHSRDYPEGEIHLSSPMWALAGPQEEAPADRKLVLSAAGGALSAAALLRWLCLLAFAGLVWLLVRFVARRIFLIDLLEPLWSEKEETGPATIGRNLFLVGRNHQWQEEVKKNRFDWVHMKDLDRPGEDWSDRKAALMESDRVILVEGFEYKFRDPELNQKKLLFLEELAGMQDRTVVVTSKVSPALLFSREARAGANDVAGPNALLVQRWRNLLSMFTVCEDDLQGILRRVEASSEIRSEVLKAECGINPHLLAIAEELDEDVRHLSREQILEEFGERAEGYYHGLWASCSSDEEVVLEHLAEEGLVNEKSRRILRRLMARGFVRRDPHFRLMNETFRMFVASATCKGEVLALEKEAAPSAWDRLRWPLFAGLAASLAFFLATQQDLVDGMLASVTGVTAGLPAMVKLFDFFGNRSDLSRLKDAR
jgi:hypothetical protein